MRSVNWPTCDLPDVVQFLVGQLMHEGLGLPRVGCTNSLLKKSTCRPSNLPSSAAASATAGPPVVDHLAGVQDRLRPSLRKVGSPDTGAQVESSADCHARRFNSSLFAWFCSGCHVAPRPSSSSYSTFMRSSGPLPSISSNGEAPWTETIQYRRRHCTRGRRVPGKTSTRALVGRDASVSR